MTTEAGLAADTCITATGIICALVAWFLLLLSDAGLKFPSGDYALVK